MFQRHARKNSEAEPREGAAAHRLYLHRHRIASRKLPFSLFLFLFTSSRTTAGLAGAILACFTDVCTVAYVCTTGMYVFSALFRVLFAYRIVDGYLHRRQHVSRRTKRSWGTPRWHLRTPGTDRRSRSCNTGSRVSCPVAGTWRTSLLALPCRPPISPSRWCESRPDGDSTSRDYRVPCTTGWSTVVATFAWSAAASSTYYYYRAATFPARLDSFIVSRADTRVSPPRLL